MVGSVIGVICGEVFGALEDGLVEFDQADVFDRVFGGVQGDGAVVRSAGFYEHAAVGGWAVAIEVGGEAGLVGIHGVEHTLDPSHEQLR